MPHISQLFVGLVCFALCACASTAEDELTIPPPAASALPAAGSPTAPTATPKLSPAREAMGNPAVGKELANKMQCMRCHSGGSLAPIAPKRHCASCHQQVVSGRYKHKAQSDSWRKNVAHLTAIPSFTNVAERLRYDWLVAFLLRPHDLRPALGYSMPRLPLDHQQARDLASWLVGGKRMAAAKEAAAPLPEQIAKGQALFKAKGCNSCHSFSGSESGRRPPLPAELRSETRAAVALAPDLRFARERLHAEWLQRWLLDPKAAKADTRMPKIPMTHAEAGQLSAFILHSPLHKATPPPAPKKLPLLGRRVSFDEVKLRVFDVTCRHCHGNPDDALGDGGPGNSGGFGFPARRINLSSYEDIASGMLDGHGNRSSLFKKNANGEPFLVAALWARHDEIRGQESKGIRGMPLGLPPLSPEDIQLVASWIAQGRPR